MIIKFNRRYSKLTYLQYHSVEFCRHNEQPIFEGRKNIIYISFFHICLFCYCYLWNETTKKRFQTVFKQGFWGSSPSFAFKKLFLPIAKRSFLRVLLLKKKNLIIISGKSNLFFSLFLCRVPEVGRVSSLQLPHWWQFLWWTWNRNGF